MRGQSVHALSSWVKNTHGGLDITSNQNQIFCLVLDVSKQACAETVLKKNNNNNTLFF